MRTPLTETHSESPLVGLAAAEKVLLSNKFEARTIDLPLKLRSS